MDAPAPCRLVIADDSVLVRAGIEALLEPEPGVTVAGRAGSLAELFDAVDEHRPDLVITDVRMPPGLADEGIEAAVRLRRTHPEVGVLVLSQFADPGYLSRLVEDGTARRGYLLKDNLASPGELVSAVELVHRGGSFIDPAVVELLVTRQARQVASPLGQLTPRETEILAAVASGKSNAAIGEALYIGHRAVEKHINSIFAKLGLHDDPASNRRVAAVLLFLQAVGGPVPPS